MYIKLTRLDKTPVWIQSVFIAALEPRRQGGTIVVPLGNDLDYEVSESPETILGLLEGAPTPTVAPVPAPRAPRAGFTDVISETGAPDTPAPVPPEAPSAEPVPRAPKARTRAAAKKTAAKAREKAPDKTSPAAELTGEQQERLAKMAPGSLHKLRNTLESQFGLANADATIAGLEKKGLFKISRDRVLWRQTQTEPNAGQQS
ncbi:MAG TPA: hypothetical protein DER26_00870 [Verrucomicrobia bacterium]|nr:hypothetical protein [Verrucomicrobiota bacterium]